MSTDAEAPFSVNATPTPSERDALLPRPRTSISHVYLRKESASWIPDGLLRCCFEVAEVKNASLVRGAPAETGIYLTADSDEKTRNSPWNILRLVLLCVATVASGAANNVTFVLMGNALDNPAFLLYFTTALYSLVYGAWYLWRKRSLKAAAAASGDPTDAKMYHSTKGDMIYYYIVSIVLITVNGAFSQFADPHVNGSLQSLINQATLPLTAIAARVYLKHKFTNLEILGATIVFLGSMLPVLPPLLWDKSKTSTSGKQMDTPFWVIVFLLSDVPSALTNVVQEKILGPDHGVKADEIHYLTWTNIGTIPTYMACTFLSLIPTFGQGGTLSELWTQQVDAFKCFGGVTPLPPGCQAHAWWPICNFVLWFVIYFYMCAVVTAKESAAFQVIVNTLVVPVSAVAFSFRGLVGAGAQTELNQWMIAGIILIPVGIVVYKGEEVIGSPNRAIVPLIARH